MAGTVQMAAQERNPVQRLLGEKAELKRQVGQQRGDIHVACVIGNEYISGIPVKLFETLGANPDEAHIEQHPAPNARQLVLSATGAVDQRCQKREGSHDHGGERDQGGRKQQGAQKAHRFATNHNKWRHEQARKRKPAPTVSLVSFALKGGRT